MNKRKTCDCHLHYHRVCDVCQHWTGNEKDVSPTDNTPHTQQLPESLFKHLRWYLDEEIEGMEGWSGKLSYADELHRRLLIGLDVWFSKTLESAKQEERKRISKLPWWNRIYKQDSLGNFVTCGQEVLDSLSHPIKEKEQNETHR